MVTPIHRKRLAIVLSLVLSAAVADATDLVLVGIREDPQDQFGEEVLVDLVSLSNGVSKELGSFRMPGGVGSGSVVGSNHQALAYFGIASGPLEGSGFVGTKMVVIHTGRVVRADVFAFSDRMVKRVSTFAGKHEELHLHLGGSVSRIGPPVADAFLAYGWLDLQRVADSPGLGLVAPGTGSSDEAGRVGSHGALFDGRLDGALTLREVGVSQEVTFALPSTPTFAEAGAVTSGYLVRSTGGSLAIAGKPTSGSPHGDRYQIFVYSQKASRWVTTLSAGTVLPTLFFLHDGMLCIPEMTTIDVGGGPQSRRTGRYTVLDLETGNRRDLTLGAAVPMRALGADIIALEGVTGKPQRVLRVTADLESAQVLYAPTGTWWQAYCLDSDVSAESFVLSYPRDERP